MALGAGKTHIGPGNGAKYRVGPQGWYTKIENRTPYANRKVSLEEMVYMNIEESSKKYSKFQEWMNEMKVDTERNVRNQSAAIKNLKTQIGQLAKKFQVKKPEVELEECKVLSLSEENKETERNTGSEKKLCGVSYLRENNVAYGRIPSQLPDKEPNPGKFLLPCTIGNFDMFALADLGASVNMMSFSLFKKLNLTNLKKTTSMVEMADMSRTTPKGTVDNILLRINKFIFHGDFLVIDMIDECNNNLILGWPFLATSYANIKVFEKEITLKNGKEKITFNHYGSLKSINTNLEEVCMIKEANISNHDQRAHLEWTCFHGTERRDIDFGDLSFQDWYKVRFRNTIINEHVIKGFHQDYDYYKSNLPFDEGESDPPEKVYNERLCSAEAGECSKNIPHEDSNQQFKINYTNPEK
ncbi:hypothetical protein CTI12_AA198710 [Artemisia annua]|uniref:Reverse transcriptase domain-containing protein n=1 Tax=Artemisia annua TaxID=35608 RepID=A0A2U1P3B5_ARTAN|nr:hypothetical protein CTI12_AA198710 [Artemisia annua]